MSFSKVTPTISSLLIDFIYSNMYLIKFDDGFTRESVLKFDILVINLSILAFHSLKSYSVICSLSIPILGNLNLKIKLKSARSFVISSTTSSM